VRGEVEEGKGRWRGGEETFPRSWC